MTERWDLTGLVWDDYVAPRVPTVKPKREPPDPVWLADDYLPNYEEALAWQPDLMSDAELLQARSEGHRLVWDTEFYPNYALLGFRDTVTNKIVYFEKYVSDGMHLRGDEDKLRWIAQNFTLVGFNDTLFDVPMLMATLVGYETDILMDCVKQIIHGEDGMGTKPAQFYRDRRLTPFTVDNIDLIALTPLGPGLKTCAGRLHAPRMADLPFPVEKVLSPQQIAILRWYWSNDLQNTQLLYESHKTAIQLREVLTRDYGVDVRSKSDPQIAEQVIRKEIQDRTGRRYIQRAQIVPWRSFRYKAPSYLQYSSSTMRWVLDFIKQQDFVVDDHGSVTMPPGLEKLDVRIGEMTYRMGIGGLHSQEKRVVHRSDENYEITDNDVTSYYPAMMIKQQMYPPNVGPEFLQVFTGIVDRRVRAKRAGDKATAETLKIVANGTFGKTLERQGYSVVYYPEMGIQTTVGGQLSLLLLIERLELAGIPVVSANTDGVTVKCPTALLGTRDAIMAQWEQDAGLSLESVRYKALYTRDVNNYIAFLHEPSTKDPTPYRWAKAKGTYAKTIDVYPMKVNPTCEICAEALIDFLATGRPVEDSVRSCTDIRRFIQMRTVTGGAVKDGVYLGKAVRWYYSTEVEGEIIYAKNGNSVAKTTGARPCMVLPDSLPADLDYQYYVDRSLAMLDDFVPKQAKKVAP